MTAPTLILPERSHAIASDLRASLGVDKVKNDWGKSWIVLPNAMYGTWENAIYEYARLSDAQKTEKRAAALELP